MNSHGLVEIDLEVERTGNSDRSAFVPRRCTIESMANGAFEHGAEQAGSESDCAE